MRDTPLSACEKNFIIKALGDRKVSRFRTFFYFKKHKILYSCARQESKSIEVEWYWIHGKYILFFKSTPNKTDLTYHIYSCLVKILANCDTSKYK